MRGTLRRLPKDTGGSRREADVSTPTRMEARWQVLIVVWALAGILVPGGLILSIAIAVWLAWQHSPYFWFFVIVMGAAGLVIAGLGLAVSFHGQVGHSAPHP